MAAQSNTAREAQQPESRIAGDVGGGRTSGKPNDSALPAVRLVRAEEVTAELGLNETINSGSAYTNMQVAFYATERQTFDIPHCAENVVALPTTPACCSLRIGDRRWRGPMQAGTINLWPYGCDGEVCVEGAHDAIHIRLMPAVFGDRSLDPSIRTDPQLHMLARMLLGEVTAGMPTGRLYGEALRDAVVARLLSRSQSSEPGASGLGSRTLERVIEYMCARLGEDITLDDLAAEAGYSSSQFTRLFRNSTGEAPYAYVLRLRLERARSLLLRSELTVSEIAAECGFYDQAHLGRHFRRRYGHSPGRVRAEP